METINMNEGHFNDIVTLSQQLLCPGISREESQSLYNKRAALGTYVKLSAEAKYFNAHDKLMAAVLELFPAKRDITVLDVGSGTGLIGQRLHDEGFLTVDALDPSQQMLEASKGRQVYRRPICSFFNEDPIDCTDNGGYIVSCMRAEHLQAMPEYNGRWQPFMNSLVDEGKQTLGSEHRYPTHYFHHDGLRFVHRGL